MVKRTFDEMETGIYHDVVYNQIDNPLSEIRKNYQFWMNKHDVALLNNHIYFNNIINEDTVVVLAEYINLLNGFMGDVSGAVNGDVSGAANGNGYNAIYLHINSGGGYLVQLMKIVDTIKNSRLEIVSVVEKSVCDCGVILASLCSQRVIRKKAVMIMSVIHSCHWGFFQQCDDDAEEIRRMRDLVYYLFLNVINSKIIGRKLDRYLCLKNTWDCKKCKKLGLVDEIL